MKVSTFRTRLGHGSRVVRGLNVLFALGMSTSAWGQIAPDALSDTVGTTTGTFRVSESGAATYSIPIYAAPGTAGVVPQMSLTYSSQAGDGPVGQGWSIGGTSTITRCRASREAGDFISGAVPVDGNPKPISFDENDAFCLDGQRLLANNTRKLGCPALSGYVSFGMSTELESYQRICAYRTDLPPEFDIEEFGQSPNFFSVERPDGSVSFYGDRDDWTASSNRSDGYVETNAPARTGHAIAWAQTRFRDSTGNYIDFKYLEDNSGTATEHHIDQVLYTGKIVLPGQPGPASLTYAVIDFDYESATTRFCIRMASLRCNV